VLLKHEDDFLSAYKTHMMKVEKELFYLKNKATEQESRLAQDDRIVTLEKQQTWFADEMDKLRKMKADNQNDIDRLQVKVFQYNDEKGFMEEQVKASKRQNKLLTVAINKSQATFDELIHENLRLEFLEKESRKLSVAVPHQNPLTSASLVAQRDDLMQYSSINNEPIKVLNPSQIIPASKVVIQGQIHNKSFMSKDDGAPTAPFTQRELAEDSKFSI
jgi:hypothetical protein